VNDRVANHDAIAHTGYMPPRTTLRASDAERERVAAFLRDQAIVGRLTADELDERVGRAYAAVTVADLDVLVADLPRPPVRPTFVRPARRGPNLVPLGIAAIVAIALPSIAWAILGVFLALGVALVALAAAVVFALAPFVLIAALCVAALRRRSRPVGWR
jgi:hypothetical protein